MKTVGIVIIVVGILVTVFTGFKFFTEKKVVDIGNLEITRDKKHVWTWSPLLGVAVMAIGGGVYFYTIRK